MSEVIFMDAVLSTMMIFWVLIFAFYVLVHRGLWIFTDVARGMGLFMLEKALGPGIELVEGRENSAARSWIIQSALWLFFGATLTFEGLWLAHEPSALHSLSAWGYNPTSASLSSAGEYATLYGAVGMAMIGASLHIMPRLLGTELASERNATLVSFLWSLATFVLVIGAHDPSILGAPVLVIGTTLQTLAFAAILINHLLTLANRTRAIALPAWLIIIGLVSDPLALLANYIAGGFETGVGQWLMVHMIGGTFFFATIAGVVLYTASVATGNALWSRTLVGATLVGSMIAINPLGAIDGSMAVGMLGLSAAELAPSMDERIVASFLMAFALIPILAFSGNTLVTIRGEDASVENSDSAGIPEINLGAVMLIPLTIGALFIQGDTLSGVAELSGMATTLGKMGIWLILVPLAFGSALALYPAISGRHLASQNRARWAFWLSAGGAAFGLTLTLMSDVIGMSLLSAGVLDPSSLAHDLSVTGSVMFYGAVIGAILHCLNMVSGLFRGTIVAEASATASSIKADSYSLASPTSVRRILAAGAGMDTEVVPVGESDEAGSATKL